jgi:uncharacterized protein with GYD domain
MPKYLYFGSYTSEGAKGLAKEGGTSRVAALEEAIKSLGGQLESFYYAFGEWDVVCIADMPNNINAATASIAIAASGAAHTKTVILLTPEEIDEAAEKSFYYRPPGQ